MRKTISLILSLLILASFVCVGAAAAPEGTAVKTAAEFLAMKADGIYYLDADIAIDASYPDPFTGTLDGNGHTVTIKGPMFVEFNGIISNLTIDGADLNLTGVDFGAIAPYSKGMTATNVINKVNVTVDGLSEDKTKGTNVGGFIGDTEGANTCVLKFRNCKNYGNITVSTAEVKATESDIAKGIMYELHVGGFAGRCAGLDMMGCNNYGNVSAPSNRGQVAGFVGRAAWSATLNELYCIDCDNSGVITSGYDAGGFFAYVGQSGNNVYTPYVIKYCVNTGDVTGGYRVGGLFGYCYASGSSFTYYFEVSYCVVAANVTAGRAATLLDGTAQTTFGSLFVGYSNSVNNTIQNCLAIGTLAAPTGENMNAPFFCINGCSSALTANCDFKNNYLCDNGATVWYTYAEADSNITQRIEIATAIAEGKVTRCTEAEAKSADVLSKLNAPAADSIFVADALSGLPVINQTLRDKRLETDAIGPIETTVEATTKAPDVTTKAPDVTSMPIDGATTAAAPGTNAPDVTTAAAPAEGGCGSVVSIGLCAVAVLGMAIVIGKKKH